MNRLTEQLLAEGYTADRHPDYVRVGCSGFGTDALQNLEGGFAYTKEYLKTKTFVTACGLCAKHHTCLVDSQIGRMMRRFEDDTAMIRCPHPCERQDESLRNAKTKYCSARMTDEAYDYERSVEKLHADAEKRKRRKMEEFIEARKGRVCNRHISFDEDADEWKWSFDIGQCARAGCRGTCPIFGELDTSRGNVFYDVATEREDTTMRGTFFEGTRIKSIVRGKRALESPASMTICRAYAKTMQNHIIWLERMRHSTDYFFHEHHGIFFRMEVSNIRAEKRESRNLMEDLQAIKDGFTVVHDSDVKKAAAAKKSEERQKRLERKNKPKKKEAKEIQMTIFDVMEADGNGS